MAIDKELFYASHGLKYPVVARQYTDDMQVKEKIYTKDEVVAMLTEIQLEIEEQNHKGSNCYRDGYTPYSEGLDDCKDIIQQKINALKAESEGKE